MATYNNYVTITKAIGIILMVIGHSGCPLWLDNLIYLFHMPLFFFCSGMFFNALNNNRDIFIFLKKKFQGLYVPFIKWSVFFLILHNIFMFIGVYNQNYGYMGGSSYYGIYDCLNSLLGLLFTMHHYEELLGGFWFIRTLFVSSIIISISSFLYRKDNEIRYLIFALVYVIISVFVRKYCPKEELYRDVALGTLGAFFYVAGFYFRKIADIISYRNSMFCSTSVLLLINWFYPDGITMNCTYNHVFPYLLSGIMGTVAVLCLSKMLENYTSYIKKGLYYIGNHTMIILTLHFLSFKIVSLIVALVYGLSLTHVAEHPVINEKLPFSSTWWVIYSIIGVVVPLSLLRCWFFISGKIRCLITNHPIKL